MVVDSPVVITIMQPVNN